MLHIDIETYSSVDLKKSGAFRYVESPDFEILLLGYSLDGGAVQVIDLAQGEDLPIELSRRLLDPATLKTAYNASFEWVCLSRYLGLTQAEQLDWLSQWRCGMLHGLYLGYPAGLSAIGKALGLEVSQQKLSSGTALIRYFSTPCKATKANGGRTRNLPAHDPEKWELYKAYNAQDVVTEMEVAKRLDGFPVPEQIQREWELDQRINLRGVRVDLDLVQHAIACFAAVKGRLTAELVGITGLANPNSVAQLKGWLEEQTGEPIGSLGKEAVTTLLASERLGDDARRALEIRQELSKTSVKKYQAMLATAGTDHRVRGLLQYYGANRTGRWAGRLVQVQNLPRTYLTAQAEARELVKRENLPALEMIYGPIPSTLSQLVRTALIPSPGCVFVDADFSAIEARVIAWLAGETWRLEVFATHGKIYEASASQMFGVPLERIQKGNPEYALRQKGKVAELALGYQGGAGALGKMGALAMGLTEEELPNIVTLWRKANPNIVKLWYAVGKAAVEAVRTGAPQTAGNVTFQVEFDPTQRLSFLTCRLPSGRSLYYPEPQISQNRFGQDCVKFWEVNGETKKWVLSDTYGGKLVENITQAIARDCLAESITRLEQMGSMDSEGARGDRGFPIVFHVHDEVVLEVPSQETVSRPKSDLGTVCAIMSEPLPWAEGLTLTADGWIGDFYTKD